MQLNKVFLKSLLTVIPMYTRFSLTGGSILFWIYLIQVITGILLGYVYTVVLDTGLPSIVFLWWETYYGSILARLHSEFGNLLFFWLFYHIFIKIWATAFYSEFDYTWITGIFILIYTYIAGITGAVMPTSILSEVTATVIGYAINSVIYIKFDCFETILLPGLGLTDETMFRVFIVHLIFPLLAFLVIIDHLMNLHTTTYTDEDEMEIILFFRHEYWDEFMWIEYWYWYEILLVFIFFRFNVDFFNLNFMSASYSLSNFSYWPLIENINFVTAIPHWYLRPLMSSLVLIPHHYLGFFFIISFFVLLFLLPWTDDNGGLIFPFTSFEYLLLKIPANLNLFAFYIIFFFFIIISYTTLIVPTGRYFIFVGSNEFLVFVYWFLICFLFIIVKLGLYLFYLSYYSIF